ncbi:MAG: PAS domain-containing protein [Gammaproteobacteria bacterium]|nr:PAS domain-containing protein [Gammaproteobacteria bacterium]
MKNPQVGCDHFPDFDELFSFFPIHVYSIDKLGCYQSCNDLQAHNFGLKNKQEVIGKTNFTLPILKKHPDVIHILNSNNNQVMASGKSLEFIEPFPQKSGALGQCKSFKIPIFEKNTVIGLIGMSFDISDETERFNTLKAKHDQTAMTLRSVMANLPEHIYWLDKNNYFLGCNTQQASDFGLADPSEVVGLHVSSFQTEENAAAIIENNKKILETGISNTSEEEFVNKQGEKVFYLSKKVPLKDPQNNSSLAIFP